MPFKSESQRRFLWLKHPDIAKRWSHEMATNQSFPNMLNQKLPKQVLKESPKPNLWGKMIKGAK